MAKKVNVEDLKEVAHFEEAATRLRDFQQKHSSVFEEFSALANEYNDLLEAAEKATKALGVSCGSFELFQTTVAYDAQALYDLLGNDKFLSVGGTVSTQRVYNLDKTRVRAAIAKKDIPAESLEHFTKTTNKFHRPSKIEIP
jgi:hypothetical protein